MRQVQDQSSRSPCRLEVNCFVPPAVPALKAQVQDQNSLSPCRLESRCACLNGSGPRSNQSLAFQARVPLCLP
eukprot:2178959-Heterocapsa_arctica.AAC.1